MTPNPPSLFKEIEKGDIDYDNKTYLLDDCPRCGKAHPINTMVLSTPIICYTGWAMCITTGEPIILKPDMTRMFLITGAEMDHYRGLHDAWVKVLEDDEATNKG